MRERSIAPAFPYLVALALTFTDRPINVAALSSPRVMPTTAEAGTGVVGGNFLRPTD